MPKKKARIQRNESIDSSASVYSPENQENNGVEMPNVISIFRESQDLHAHDRLISQLKLDFYEKLIIQDFCQEFLDGCRFIISCEDRTFPDPILRFVVKFIIYILAKSENTDSKFKSLKLMKKFISFLTEYHDLQEPYVRFHIVRAIKFLLNELTDDIEIPDICFEKLQDALLKRFWDLKSYIRAEAASASSRLQSPSDADCAIVISLIHLCKFDSSHTVRLSAIQALAITTKTLPVIITHCLDVNDLVRRKSYELLLKWKILKPLTVSKRLFIMENGLTDRSEPVRHACIELLKCWLQSSNGDPVALLKRLDVENSEESTELTLKVLLRSISSVELAKLVDEFVAKMDLEIKLVREDQLNCETAFLWKNLVQFLSDKKTGDPDLLEKIIPNIVNFEQYLRKLFRKSLDQVDDNQINLEKSLEYYTIIKYLLVIVRYMDIFDEHNRIKMIEMIKWALSENISFNYVEHLMKLLVHLEHNNEKICNLTVELVNELLFNDVDQKSDTLPDEQSIHSIPAQPSIHGESVAPISSTPLPAAPKVDPTVANREAIRKIRIQIAEIDVRINELNESVANCTRNQQFERMEGVISNLKKLTEEKSALISQNDQLMAPILSARNIESSEPAGTGTVNDEQVDNDCCLLDPSNGVRIKEEKENQAWMAPGMENKIIKANIMMSSMIRECKMQWKLPSSLRTLFENVILVSVQHTDLNVRSKSIFSIGMCCQLDKDLAISYYGLLMQSLLIDHESVKENALKTLIDIFIRFGIEPFQEAMITNKMKKSEIKQENDKTDDRLDSTFCDSEATAMTEEDYNKCTTELMTPIIDLLNSQNTEIQTTVAIGLSKLLCNHRLMSSKLLSRLLLLWFNPITEDNYDLRKYLEVFFSNFAAMSADNQESITNCFLITMRTLLKAPAQSPLLEIDLNNVIHYFERITDSSFLIDNRKPEVADRTKLDNPCHDSLAVMITNQIMNAPLSPEVKHYVPLLERLRLSPSNIDLLRVLEPLVATMIKKVKDKKCVLTLEKFYKSLGKRIDEHERLTQVPGEHIEGEHASSIDLDRTLIAPEPAPQGEVIAPANQNVGVNESSIPSLLERDSEGQKMDLTYLGRRNMQRPNHLVTDPVDRLSSLNLNTTKDTSRSRSAMSSSFVDSINMPPPAMSGDEPIFKKPKNVRVTRSSSRLQMSGDSSISSIDSNVTTSTRLPQTRRNSQRTKKPE